MYFNVFLYYFFFNITATTKIYTLSLHDALPISSSICLDGVLLATANHREPRVILNMVVPSPANNSRNNVIGNRSEEHTSELQSQSNLVCRLLLEKKKKLTNIQLHSTFQKTYPIN